MKKLLRQTPIDLLTIIDEYSEQMFILRRKVKGILRELKRGNLKIRHRTDIRDRSIVKVKYIHKTSDIFINTAFCKNCGNYIITSSDVYIDFMRMMLRVGYKPFTINQFCVCR